jgi:hypothetical protein
MEMSGQRLRSSLKSSVTDPGFDLSLQGWFTRWHYNCSPHLQIGSL